MLPKALLPLVFLGLRSRGRLSVQMTRSVLYLYNGGIGPSGKALLDLAKLFCYKVEIKTQIEAC